MIELAGTSDYGFFAYINIWSYLKIKYFKKPYFFIARRVVAIALCMAV
jgi:hypothetical protein